MEKVSGIEDEVMEEDDEAVVELFKPDAEEEVAREAESKQNAWIDVDGGEVAPMTPRRSPMTEEKGLSQGGAEDEFRCSPCGLFGDEDAEEGRRP